jgi:amino acid adenylation domain-containing protein
MLVHQFLETSAEQFPDKIALIFKNQRLTYAQIEESANALAWALVKRGLCPCDRVVICLPNSPEAVIAVFGVLKASGVFVFLNPSIKEQKLRYIVNNCRASALICTDRHTRFYEKAREAFPTIATVIQVRSVAATGSTPPDTLFFDDCTRSARTDRLPCRSADTEIASIIYTSGSTGEPKGVVCGHDNISFVSNSIITYLSSSAEDTVINVLPLSFDYGLYQLLMTFRTGGTLVLEPAFVYPNEVVERIQAEKVTGFPMVPTVLALLLQSNWAPDLLRSLRYISNTAAALPVNHIQAIRKKLPWLTFFSMYGLTECKRALYLPPEQIDIRPSSVGIAIPGTEVWLEDEWGNRLGPGCTGELVIQGQHVMRGYWDDLAATAAVFKEGPQPGVRILRSGDLFKSDEAGCFYFLSRKDDMIKSRGEKVSPREVEDAAYTLDSVLEAAAIGVPDPILGQKIKLFVVSSDSSLTEQAVKRRCRELLEDFMVPQVVEIKDNLPKTDSGKIDKKILT